MTVRQQLTVAGITFGDIAKAVLKYDWTTREDGTSYIIKRSIMSSDCNETSQKLRTKLEEYWRIKIGFHIDHKICWFILDPPMGDREIWGPFPAENISEREEVAHAMGDLLEDHWDGQATRMLLDTGLWWVTIRGRGEMVQIQLHTIPPTPILFLTDYL